MLIFIHSKVWSHQFVLASITQTPMNGLGCQRVLARTVNREQADVFAVAFTHAVQCNRWVTFACSQQNAIRVQCDIDSLLDDLCWAGLQH